jgi:predicted lipid carrier protein YhbT
MSAPGLLLQLAARLPPPARWAPVLRPLPVRWSTLPLLDVLRVTLAVPLAQGALGFLEGRVLAVEATDLGLVWRLTLHEGRLQASEAAADASIRGSVTDLLLLASRLEDADTLFFRRRLEVTGDTELGLTARNLLDQLDWEQLPLAPRILLVRAAHLARAARSAFQARQAVRRASKPAAG